MVLNRNWISVLLMCVSISVSYILYEKSMTWGSLWCWVSNVFALYLIYNVFEEDVCLYLKI